jgi:hypothetical protein
MTNVALAYPADRNLPVQSRNLVPLRLRSHRVITSISLVATYGEAEQHISPQAIEEQQARTAPAT